MKNTFEKFLKRKNNFIVIILPRKVNISLKLKRVAFQLNFK